MKILSLALVSYLLIGCDAAIKDFVKGATPPERIDLPSVAPPDPSVQSDGSIFLSLSPSVVSSGGSMTMDARINPTAQIFSGGDISAHLSISRVRVSNQ